MSQNKKIISILSEKSPWKNNENKIWLTSTLSLFRNIEKFHFPGKLDTRKKESAASLIGSELTKVKELKNPTLYSADSVDALGKEFITEHFLSIENFRQADKGEAFILDDTAEFLATLNIHNHIHFQVMENRGELETAWNKIIKIETEVGKSLSYAYSARFGFLTTDPSESGTALQMTVHLQLPALIHTDKIDEVLEKICDESVTVTGISGSPTEIIGDIITIKNNYTLGVTEENILTTIRNITMKLMLEENAARSQIRKDENPTVKDLVSRAYGILVHSYQIEAIEALNAISLIKLGADFGWITGMETHEYNELFFNCRRAHLLSQFDREVKQEELSHARAEFIHKALKKIDLKI